MTTNDDQQQLVPIHLLHFAHRSQNCYGWYNNSIAMRKGQICPAVPVSKGAGGGQEGGGQLPPLGSSASGFLLKKKHVQFFKIRPFVYNIYIVYRNNIFTLFFLGKLRPPVWKNLGLHPQPSDSYVPLYNSHAN